MQSRRMGAPFYMKNYEIHDQLAELGAGLNEFYDNIVRNAIIREHWEEEDSIWVRGSFRAQPGDMIAWHPDLSRATCYRRMAKLIEAGIIVKNDDGSFDIPRYKKRGDEGIRESEFKIMSQKIGQMEEDIQEIRKTLQIRPKNETKEASNETNRLTHETNCLTSETKEASNETAYPFKVVEERDQEEEEAALPVVADSQETEAEPGSRSWIVERIRNLWPARGFRPEEDAEYLEELEKFSAQELEAAFERARADNAKYGNYSYLLNYLRNPGLYDKNRSAKGKGRKKRGQPDQDDDIGTLEDADWLEE